MHRRELLADRAEVRPQLVQRLALGNLKLGRPARWPYPASAPSKIFIISDAIRLIVPRADAVSICQFRRARSSVRSLQSQDLVLLELLGLELGINRAEGTSW